MKKLSFGLAGLLLAAVGATVLNPRSQPRLSIVQWSLFLRPQLRGQFRQFLFDGL
jgi:hypothetical protein